MAKDDRSSKTPPGNLSPGDAALWQRVADTARPLEKGKNRLVRTPEPPCGGEPPRSPPAPKPRPQGKPEGKLSAAPKPPAAPPPGQYDRREARALAAGRAEIDARIDLHWMRQREAHAALRAFIHGARARGHRHVLVITGKGARVDAEPGERGVLNREVPRWLGEPDFRELVVGFTPAHKRHGGEGALYVRLRKNRPKD